MYRARVLDGGGTGFRARNVLIRSDGTLQLLGTAAEIEYSGKIETRSQLFEFLKAQAAKGEYFCLAVAGEIRDHQIVVKSPNCPYLDGLNLVETMRGFGAKYVIVGNDMEVAAVGMYEIAKRPQGLVWVITLSSGVGGNILSDGHPMLSICEPGHIKIGMGSRAPKCNCGGRGCVEAYISGNSLKAIMVNWGIEAPDGRDPLEYATAEYHKGTKWAIRLYQKAAELFGRALGNFTCFGGKPTTVLVKGGVGLNMLPLDGIIEIVRKSMVKHGMVGGLWDVPIELIPSDFGGYLADDDSFIGGAEMVRRYFLNGSLN